MRLFIYLSVFIGIASQLRSSGDAKDLFRSIRAGKETRVRLLLNVHTTMVSYAAFSDWLSKVK